MKKITIWSQLFVLRVRYFFPGISDWIGLSAFPAWIALSCGIWVCSIAYNFQKSAVTYHDSLYTFLITTAIIMSLTAGLLLRSFLFRNFLFGILGFLVYFSAMNAEHRFYTEVTAQHRSQVVATGQVMSIPAISYEGFRFLFKIEQCDSGFDAWKGKIVRCTSYRSPEYFGTLTIRGSLQLPLPQQNPYGYDEYGWFMSEGIRGKIAADTICGVEKTHDLFRKIHIRFRESVIRALDRISENDARAFMLAAFLNEREYLSDDIQQDCRNSGIYHLLSISGLHTAMITAALLFFFGLFPIKRSLRIILALCGLWLYSLFIGMIPCLFRATLMTTIIGLCFLFQKKNYSLNALGLAGFLWLLISPYSLFQPGYQLSFAATFGIMTLYPLLHKNLMPAANSPFLFIICKIIAGLYISLSSFIATVPILIYHFGAISFFGLFANLIVVPVTTAAMWFFFAGLLCTFCFSPLALIPMKIVEAAIQLILAVAHVSSFIPFSTHTFTVPYTETVIICLIFMIGLLTIRKQLYRTYLLWAPVIVMIIIPISLIVHRLDQSARIAVFTLRESSCCAVKWPGQRAWVIANGKGSVISRLFDREVSSWLRHNRISNVNAVALPPDILAKTALTGFFTRSASHGTVLLLPGKPVRESEMQAITLEVERSLLNATYHPDTYSSFRIQNDSTAFRVMINVHGKGLVWKPDICNLDIHAPDVQETIKGSCDLIISQSVVKIRKYPPPECPISIPSL